MRRIRWLEFPPEPTGLQQATPAQVLEQLLTRKWQLAPGDKDLVVGRTWTKHDGGLGGPGGPPFSHSPHIGSGAKPDVTQEGRRACRIPYGRSLRRAEHEQASVHPADPCARA